MRGALQERFWAKVRKTTACWLWTAGDNGLGYGLIGEGGRGCRRLYAHRVSWEIHNGPIPKGMSVLHRCDNPPCVRPDHLWLGTQGDNLRDMVAKGRDGFRTHPDRWIRGEEHHKAVVTEADVIEIRKVYKERKGSKALALKFGLTESSIHDIVYRRS